MTDITVTIGDIARAIERLSAIRVRQQVAGRCSLGSVSIGMELDLEAEDVRQQIVILAAGLPAISQHAEGEMLRAAS